MGSRGSLVLLIAFALAPAAAAGHEALIEKAVSGTPAEARAALAELSACDDPAALPALLKAIPEIPKPLIPVAEKAATAMARRHSETVVLDAVAEAPAPLLLADLITRKRTAELAARLRTEASRDLAGPLADTGRLEAADLLLTALAETEGVPRLHLILSLGRLQGFGDRVVPVLRKLREAGKPEEAEAILRSALRFTGKQTTTWLVKEAMGNGLEALAAVFDPPSRTDVLRALVNRVPRSIPALEKLTGKEFGGKTHLWLLWIDEIEREVDPERSSARKPRPEKPPRDRPNFYGIPIPKCDFVLLLDASNSMNRGKRKKRIDEVKEKVVEVLEALPETQRFNVVFYNSTSRSFRHRCVFATLLEVEQAKEWLGTVRARGMTDLSSGLWTAIRDRRVGEIILLSDGAPNTGTVKKPEDVIRLLRGREVKIHTLSPPRRDGGPQPNMKKIAELTGGMAGTF